MLLSITHFFAQNLLGISFVEWDESSRTPSPGVLWEGRGGVLCMIVSRTLQQCEIMATDRYVCSLQEDKKFGIRADVPGVDKNDIQVETGWRGLLGTGLLHMFCCVLNYFCCMQRLYNVCNLKLAVLPSFGAFCGYLIACRLLRTGSR